MTSTISVNVLSGLNRFIESPESQPLITDIMTPDWDCTQLIRPQKKSAPSLEIIAISGGGCCENFHNQREAIKLGANKVILKPFSPGNMY